jgi:hypothetical protein
MGKYDYKTFVLPQVLLILSGKNGKTICRFDMKTAIHSDQFALGKSPNEKAFNSNLSAPS